MPKTLSGALSLLLGEGPHQRAYVAMTLISIAIHALCLAAQWMWVRLGYASATYGAALAIVIAVNQAAFYTALRSGWSRRFADPALTMVQMVCALLSLGAAYLVNPQVRGVLLMVVALVLVFGAFTLKPAHCRALGWLAVAIFGVAMFSGARWAPQSFTPVVELLSFLFSVAIMPLIGHLAGQLSKLRHDLHRQKKELRAALERTNRLAIRDELTGLPNRRHMRERAEHEVQRVRRSQSSLCVGILDLDHFKTVNDQLGHAAGDAVLMNFALQAQSVLRETDILARWGGEEFLLLCPDTTIDQALQVMERVHAHLRRPESWQSCPVERVTFSAGLADHDPHANFEQTLSLADAALYKAKSMGRDRCIVA